MDLHPRFLPRVRRLAGAPPPVDTLLARLAGHAGRAALDSAAGRPARWSWLAFDPLPGPLPETPRGLRALLARVERCSGDAIPGPFRGGFVGAFAYDLGVAGEERCWHARDPWGTGGGTPPIAGGLYVDFLVLDHERDAWWLVLGEEPGDGRPPVEERARRIERELAAPLAPSRRATAFRAPRRLTSPAEHARRIELARAAIARGDYYQANLAHRFEAEIDCAPEALYASLRAVNPAPYMGFLEWESPAPGALLSASPELLLEVADGRARTRPIKGTVRRSSDPSEDARLARALLASEKDRAELAMIVDLERNDLGRVARVGTVRTGAFPRLESFAGVHHLVADVECELAPGRDAVDALDALFPGGSITGAPKLAAMRAIADLEGEGRGFFTGSLGYLDLEGRACFNILIRTLVQRPGEVAFHVGGGITWSSDAGAEDAETLVKADRLLAALNALAPEAVPT